MKILDATIDELPQDWSQIHGPTNIDGARHDYSELFGFGDAYQTGFLDDKKHLSVRNTVPYLFLSKSVIDSDVVLFHGFSDATRRISHERGFPYFLGVIDENAVRAQARMKDLRRQIRDGERRNDQVRVGEEERIRLLDALVNEAVQVGLLSGVPSERNEQTYIRLLRHVSDWTPDQTSPPDGSRLRQIVEERADLLKRLRDLERRRDSARRQVRDAELYSEVMDFQEERLRAALLIDGDGALAHCPICGAESHGPTEELQAIERSIRALNVRRNHTTQRRPRLDDYVADLSENITDLRTRLRALDGVQKALVDEDARAENRFRVEQRAVHVAGRISLYLETMHQEAPLEAANDGLEHLRSELSTLEGHYGIDAVRWASRMVDRAVALAMNRYFHQLPTVEPCSEAEILFDSTRVDAHLVRADDSPVHWRDIGSDQNYLALHMALVLGLQEFFGRKERPVPAVVLIDQVSRPYFPPTERPEEIQLSANADDPETAALRRHFDALFRWVEAVDGGLQAIVLEHAYFGDDPRYVQSVRYRWSDDPRNKLVPHDWPSHRA